MLEICLHIFWNILDLCHIHYTTYLCVCACVYIFMILRVSACLLIIVYLHDCMTCVDTSLNLWVCQWTSIETEGSRALLFPLPPSLKGKGWWKCSKDTCRMLHNQLQYHLDDNGLRKHTKTITTAVGPGNHPTLPKSFPDQPCRSHRIVELQQRNQSHDTCAHVVRHAHPHGSSFTRSSVRVFTDLHLDEEKILMRLPRFILGVRC